MELTTQKIAEVLNGRVEGDPHILIKTFARIESGKPGAICFFANPKYEKYVYTSKASAIIINEDFQLSQPVSAKIAVHEGGLIGKGIGNSTQKYKVQNIYGDYMYSFLVEETASWKF